MKIKKFLFTLLLLCAAAVIAPMQANADEEVIASGYYGTHTVNWVLYEDGTLVLSGRVDSYSQSDMTYKWTPYKDQVTSVVIEEGIQRITARAFLNFTNLTSVTIPDSVEYIDTAAFANCTSLRFINIPASVKHIYPRAFSNCSKLRDVNFAENCQLESIDELAFTGCNLKALTIPSSVTAVGERAFAECKNLTTLNLQEGVVSIAKEAFADCPSLTGYVCIPESATEVANIFEGTDGIECLEIKGHPIDMTGKTELKQVIFSGATQIISGFKDCTGLTQVTINPQAEMIGYAAFEGCTSLRSIQLPEGLSEIQSYAFSGSGLTEIVIPDSVTKIGYCVFADCVDLRAAICGNGVQVLEYDTFSDCNSLTMVDLGNVEAIHNNVFVNCTELRVIQWSDRLERILDSAFANCDSLSQMDIPASVIEIGINCFGNCDNLKSIVFRGDLPTFGYAGCFENVTAVAYYPPGNETWSDDPVNAGEVELLYPGNITWMPWCDEHNAEKREGEASTCTTTGLSDGEYCAECGFAVRAQELIPPAGHDYNEEVIAPTCTEGGYSIYTCVCGDRYEDGYVDAAGHQWGEWTVTKAATQTEEGSRFHTCFCGEREEEVIPKLPVITFTDVPEKTWYSDAVNWAVAGGVTSGIGNNLFGPDMECSRGQVVTFLWRAAGSPEPTSDQNPFTDVVEGTYYYKAVLWAVEKGITSGTSTTTFSPDLGCSRSQVTTFLYRTMGSPAVEEGGNPFTDVPEGQWYTKAVLWAAAEGITSGTSADTFSPDMACSRSQIVTFLYRCMG